jgi:hypothetical protein
MRVLIGLSALLGVAHATRVTTIIQSVVESRRIKTVSDEAYKETPTNVYEHNKHNQQEEPAASGDASIPCGCELLQFSISYDDSTAGYTETDVGSSLQYPLSDIETGETIGMYQDVATKIADGEDDCTFLAVYSIKLDDGSSSSSQIMVQGTCSSPSNAIVGGTGKYACVDGYDYTTEVSNASVVANLVVCNAGCGKKSNTCAAPQSDKKDNVEYDAKETTKEEDTASSKTKEDTGNSEAEDMKEEKAEKAPKKGANKGMRLRI